MSRRTPPRRPRAAKNASWLPLIPLAVLIVIGGLAIGALISKVFAQKDEAQTTVVTATPGAKATSAPHAPRPVIVATIVPRITPSPVPTPTDLPSPSPEPTATLVPTAKPTASPKAAAPPSDRPSERPTPTDRPMASAAPVASAVPSRAPIAVPSATPVARKRTPPPPATMPPDSRPSAAAPAAAANPAVGVVRRYLDAIKRGDEVGAYAALGGSPGDKGLSLSEESFVDRTARVKVVRATPSEDGSSTIEVEIVSAKGSYFSTFHVVQNTKGFIIDQHDSIKP